MVYSTGRTTFLIALGLFSVVFLFLGLAITEWGFLHDDYGTIWHAAQITSWNDFLKLFSNPGMHSVVQPSNCVLPEQSFFVVIYRPLACVLHALQIFFFGFFAHKHFLFTIFFHAINTALLFFLYSRLLSRNAAIWGAAFFAFHLSGWDWLGWISGQTHIITLTMMLLLSIMTFYFIQTKKPILLGGIGLLHLVALFFREKPIVFPVLLILIYLFYRKNFPVTAHLKPVILVTTITNLCYLVIRNIFYPMEAERQGGNFIIKLFTDFIGSIPDRFFDAVTYIVDITNLAWMPGGNRLFKGIAIICMTMLLGFILAHRVKLKEIVFCFLSMCLLMWPMLVRHYSSRYLYCALPVLCLLFALALTDSDQQSPRFFAFKKTMLWFFLIFSMTMLPLHLKSRGQILNTYNQAFITLAADKSLFHKEICFIALPYDFFTTGNAQALWMYELPTNTPVYYDRRTFTWTKPLLATNLLDIKKIETGFRLSSKDSSQLWFLPLDQSTNMGEIIVNAKDQKSGNISSMDFILYPVWLKKDLVFITWDQKKQNFKFLP